MLRDSGGGGQSAPFTYSGRAEALRYATRDPTTERGDTTEAMGARSRRDAWEAARRDYVRFLACLGAVTASCTVVPMSPSASHTIATKPRPGAGSIG